MKKIIIVILACLLFVGCSKKEKEIKKEKPKKEIVKTYKDENKVKIGLYNDRTLVKEFSTKLQDATDIGVFTSYFTNVDTLENSNFKYNFNKYYNEYQNIENHKIGYYVSFYVKDKLYEKTITDPTSTFSLQPYIYVYLYDDLNQPDGAFYSHVEEKDVKEDTIYTSIKLFMMSNVNEITSNITLKAFTYDSEDDFDKDGKYRGNSYYEVIIKTN